LVIALNKNLCYELFYQPNTEQFIINTYKENEHYNIEKIELKSKSKIFAPGNLRATKDNMNYNNLVQEYISNCFTLRYTGGMVPDVYHILIKKQGIFTNISSEKSKAKLRLLYECSPIAYIIESCQNGISAVDPEFLKGSNNENKLISVLDYKIDTCDQRIGIFYGCIEDVELFKKHFSLV